MFLCFRFLAVFQLAQIPPQGGAADAQLPGGGGAVAAVGGYRLLHHLADDAFQRAGGVGADHRSRVGCRGAAQAALFREQVGHAAAADVGAAGQGGKGAQQVFELGVVVRPRVLPQHLDGAGLKAGDLLA